MVNEAFAVRAAVGAAEETAGVNALPPEQPLNIVEATTSESATVR